MNLLINNTEQSCICERLLNLKDYLVTFVRVRVNFKSLWCISHNEYFIIFQSNMINVKLFVIGWFKIRFLFRCFFFEGSLFNCIINVFIFYLNFLDLLNWNYKHFQYSFSLSPTRTEHTLVFMVFDHAD